MYYISVDEDETIVLTDIVNGNQILCKTVEYTVNSSGHGFVLADNRIIYDAGLVGDITDLDTEFTSAYTIEIISEFDNNLNEGNENE